MPLKHVQTLSCAPIPHSSCEVIRHCHGCLVDITHLDRVDSASVTLKHLLALPLSNLPNSATTELLVSLQCSILLQELAA